MIRAAAVALMVACFVVIGTLDCAAGNVRLGLGSFALAVANYLFLV